MTLTNMDKLRKTPYEIAHDKLELKMDSGIGFVLSDLDVLINKSKIILKPNRASLENPNWKYYGYAMWSYTKADLGKAFNHIGIKLYLSVPFTTADVVTKMVEIFNISMLADDFEEQSIGAINEASLDFTLKAKQKSPMWSGEVILKIYESPPGFDW